MSFKSPCPEVHIGNALWQRRVSSASLPAGLAGSDKHEAVCVCWWILTFVSSLCIGNIHGAQKANLFILSTTCTLQEQSVLCQRVSENLRQA